jgi:MFS family permease
VSESAPAVSAVSEPSRLRDAPKTLWLIFASAFLGWTFDAMDLNIFTLILTPTVQDLSGSADPAAVARIGGAIIALKLFAWGLGGVVFGVLTDRFGRARILGITVVIYAVFTGLSALATSTWQLAVFQMLAGLGIGGEWAAGAALLAETWPEKLRPKVMQLMQMGFAVGFFVAALLNQFIGPYGWRWVFAAGLVPILVTIVVRRFVPEPERWKQVRQQQSTSSGVPLRQLFAPRLRRSTVVGILIGIAMMVGCWGGLTWIPSWIGQLVAAEGGKNAGSLTSAAFMLLNAGAVVGYLLLMWLADVLGRKPTFALFCAGSLAISLVLFTQATTVGAILWLMPLYGFFTIGGFGIFAIYLPELFPTVIRATGQGLCWNFARALTGFGVLGTGLLVGSLGSLPAAAAVVSLVYILGLVAIWFGPETRGQRLADL